MYIQITTRCNMSCEHCCYACTMEGEDMTLDTFKAVMEHCAGDYISLGGGEPTLHPNFWEFLGLSIGRCEGVWLATNGSQTETALALAKMARKGVIGCALSQDPWHDEIDDEVVEAFTDGRSENHWGNSNEDCREIRDVSGNEERMSPYRDPEDGGNPDNCPCAGVMVRPNGDVHVCGCKDSPCLGNVRNGFEIPYNLDTNECYRNQYDPDTGLLRADFEDEQPDYAEQQQVA